MELLKRHNWVLWKWHMLAILQDLELEKYIEKDAILPEPADKANLTQDERRDGKKVTRKHVHASNYL